MRRSVIFCRRNGSENKSCALDGHVTVTIEEASPEAVDLCRFVAKELARRGYDEVAVRTEW
jgi:hypothetical protein